MEIQGTGSTGSTAGASSRYGEMETEDFMRILFTELTSQDPFKPQDSQALLEQINTVRSIESNMTLMDQMRTMVDRQAFAAAGTLVGKAVRGLDESFTAVEGRVKSVAIEGEELILTLDTGARVPFDHIEEIFEPAS